MQDYTYPSGYGQITYSLSGFSFTGGVFSLVDNTGISDPCTDPQVHFQLSIHCTVQVDCCRHKPPTDWTQYVRNARINDTQCGDAMPVGTRACRPLGR